MTTPLSDRVKAAETVAISMRSCWIAEEAFPLVLGPWVRSGVPTAVDRQFGLAYGAGAMGFERREKLE